MAQTIAEQVTARAAGTARRGAGPQRFVAGWAALGITLSGATQLRLGGLPVGPSELILAAWLFFVVLLLLRGVKVARSRASLVLGGYWLCALTLLGLGALVAVHTRRGNVGDAIHDGTAFVYIAVLTTFLALRLFGGDYRYHWQFALSAFFLHALAAGVLLGLAMATPQLGPIRFWYAGVRFSGWAENPNQMALAMAAMPFLGWWLLHGASSQIGKAAYAFGIALCIAAGIATQSDGLRVAWLASIGAIGALLFYRVSRRGRSRWLHVSHIIAPALVVTIAVFYGDVVVDMAYRVAESIYAAGDQGNLRFTLWWHGIEAIQASPLVGLGPGAFSGYYGPFEGGEAHNTFIDWGMSTGLVGILTYAALLGWVAWCALRSRETMFVGMWMSVVVASIFGYLLRHPDFWMVLVLVLVFSESAISARERQPPRSGYEPDHRALSLNSRSARSIGQSGPR